MSEGAGLGRRLLRNVHLARALFWTWLRRPAAALQALDEVVAIEPGAGAAAWLALRGRLLRETDRPQEAEAAYKQSVALDPGSAAAHLEYAEALMDWGRLEEASRELGIAERLAPRSPRLERAQAEYAARTASGQR